MRVTALVLLSAVALAQDGPAPARTIIDAEVKAKWRDAKLAPVPLCDDSEFLRRAYLDIVGTIPSLERVEKFLADGAADKRARLVDELLASDGYAENWSTIWANSLAAGGSGRGEQAIQLLASRFKESFAKNVPMGEFARMVITATGKYEQDGRGGGEMMAAAGSSDVALIMLYYGWFQTAGRDFPMALANKFSRQFMGVQISCAQCHDHPFDKWTQEDFYGMAAFFTTTRSARIVDRDEAGREVEKVTWELSERAPGRRGTLTVPGSNKPATPAWLGSREAPAAGKMMREEFARMLTDRGNLQFARGIVNRTWAHFFGRGFVHPADDFNVKNKPSHPELLEALAHAFMERGQDVKWLIREICTSEAYQRSSRTKERTIEAQKLLAVARVRALSPEQLLNAIIAASFVDPSSVDARMRAGLLRNFRFTFGDDEGVEVVEFEGTVPEALMMMNSDVIARATGAGGGRVGQTRVDQIWKERKGDDERVRAVFLSALSRPPSKAELERHVPRVKAKGKEGLADVLWALLNSSEFIFQH